MSKSFVSIKAEGRGIYRSEKQKKEKKSLLLPKSLFSFPARVSAVVARTAWPGADRKIMQVNDDSEEFSNPMGKMRTEVTCEPRHDAIFFLRAH